MVREVVAGQGVEQVRVVVEVGGGERDELPVPGRRCAVPGPGQVRLRLGGHECCRHQQPGGVAGLGQIEDRGRRRVVAADQLAEQDLDIDAHALTVLGGTDDPLTAT